MKRTLAAAHLHLLAVTANAMALANPELARHEATDLFFAVATERITAIEAKINEICALAKIEPLAEEAPEAVDLAEVLPAGVTVASAPADKVASVLIPSSPAGAAGGVPDTTSTAASGAAGSDVDPAAAAVGTGG